MISLPAGPKAPGAVVCGYRIENEGEEMRASEFEVFLCGASESLLQVTAVRDALLSRQGERLVVTVLETWPFGEDWGWTEVPVWRYDIDPRDEEPVRKKVVVSVPALTQGEIAEGLAFWDEARAQGTGQEHYEDLIGRTLAMALAGSEPARRNLLYIDEVVTLDGHAGEVWMDAYDLFQAYAEETGTVRKLTSEELKAAGERAAERWIARYPPP